jgi:tetratricopeptide (TPR) repeat protein
MGNKEMHPRFFDVMHLGMSDADPGVREYAAAYIEMQGLPNFEHDAKGYTRWRKQNEGRPAKKIVGGSEETIVDEVGQADRVIENAETLAASGWKLWQQQRFGDAAEKFEAAVRLDPKAANAWNGLGWSRFNGGDSEQAVAAFEKCVALQPRHPAALNGLGQVYLSWKQYAEAEKYLLLAAPQAPAAWYGLARLYLLEEKFSDAKPWIEKIVAQNPDDQSVHQMAEAVEAGKLDDELRRLIEPPGKPKNISADAIRGWAMFQQGKMRIAERLFRRALEADGENLSALNGLAFCLLSQGNHEQAQPLFEKYLAKEKDAAGPMNGLARCLKASGKVDEAVELWQRMAKLYPGPNAAAVGLATTYLEQKQYAEAVKYFKELVDANPENDAFQRGLKSAEKGAAAND